MVLVAEPTKPATAAATSRLKRTSAANVAHAVRPMNSRGRIATEGSLKNGTVARRKLRRPNTRPEKMPTIGPAITPPRIVGRCSVVAEPEILGRGINPSPGTTPRMMVMAARTPAMTIRSVVKVQGLLVEVRTETLLTVKAPLLQR